MGNPELKKMMKTVLYETHCALGAKMTDFSGWEMPLQYQSAINEHHIVRDKVGVFDVSHMGRILVSGPDAEVFLESLSTNTIKGKKNFTATYTVLTNHQGGSVDDTIIYRYHSEYFFLVTNAANRNKDLMHLLHESKNYQVKIQDHFAEDAILAVQGPKANDVLFSLFPELDALKPMQFLEVSYKGSTFPVASTGYTGAGGFELYPPNSLSVSLWEALMDLEVAPIGLAARDTLRLEKGFALYGHELDDSIAPNESISKWTVKDHSFLGRDAMVVPAKRFQYGVLMEGRHIPRKDCRVMKGQEEIGVVTSGGFGPSIEKGIAIVMLNEELAIGEDLEVEIRGKLCSAKLTKLPFV
jgi:aminomethyltransferase